MENQYGDAKAVLPTGMAGPKPGYQAYLETLGGQGENPASVILSAADPCVLQIVRACSPVFGPVYHLADPDHAAILAVVAQLEPGGIALAVTGGRILLTRTGGTCGCPFCGVYGGDGAAGRSNGACPVIAGEAPASAERLPDRLLCLLPVLVELLCDAGGESGGNDVLGFSLDLAGKMPDPPRPVWADVAVPGLNVYRAVRELGGSAGFASPRSAAG